MAFQHFDLTMEPVRELSKQEYHQSLARNADQQRDLTRFSKADDAITVHLRQKRQPYDPVGLTVRTLRLLPGSPMPIGRSSKNEMKNLIPHCDNAYFDSKVMSREHATICVPAANAGTIEITDSSKYGVFVNGVRIGKGVPHRLRRNDIVKFGEVICGPSDDLEHKPVEVTIEYYESQNTVNRFQDHFLDNIGLEDEIDDLDYKVNDFSEPENTSSSSPNDGPSYAVPESDAASEQLGSDDEEDEVENRSDGQIEAEKEPRALKRDVPTSTHGPTNGGISLDTCYRHGVNTGRIAQAEKDNLGKTTPINTQGSTLWPKRFPFTNELSQAWPEARTTEELETATNYDYDHEEGSVSDYDEGFADSDLSEVDLESPATSQKTPDIGPDDPKAPPPASLEDFDALRADLTKHVDTLMNELQVPQTNPAPIQPTAGPDLKTIGAREVDHINTRPEVSDSGIEHPQLSSTQSVPATGRIFDRISIDKLINTEARTNAPVVVHGTKRKAEAAEYGPASKKRGSATPVVQAVKIGEKTGEKEPSADNVLQTIVQALTGDIVNFTEVVPDTKKSPSTAVPTMAELAKKKIAEASKKASVGEASKKALTADKMPCRSPNRPKSKVKPKAVRSRKERELLQARRSRDSSYLRSYFKTAAAAGAYATLGSLATIAFLASPVAERLAGL